MIKIHNLGFPRLGEHRELKFALERYWRNELGRDELEKISAELRQRHWQLQASAAWISFQLVIFPIMIKFWIRAFCSALSPNDSDHQQALILISGWLAVSQTMVKPIVLVK